ncbi:MAG: response regulator [Victivallales bacterium]
MKSSAGNKKAGESLEEIKKLPVPPVGRSAANKINKVKPSTKTAIKVQIKKQDVIKTATSSLKKTDVKKITVSFAPAKKTVKKPAPAKKAVKKTAALKKTAVKSVKEPPKALPVETPKVLQKEPTKLLPKEPQGEPPKTLPLEVPKPLQVEVPKESPKNIPETPVEIKVVVEEAGAAPKPAKIESIPEEAHSLSKDDSVKEQEKDKVQASPPPKGGDAGLAAKYDEEVIILNEAYAIDSQGNKLSLHQEFIPDLDSQLSKAKILVADDSVIYQVGYMQMLEFLGHEVVMCGNGLQAVKRFKETRPELVILDVDMPEMNGFEACREIRKTPEGLNVPIIMVSSGDTEEDIVNGMNSGANDYLIKPVKEAHMIAKLKTFLKFTVVHKDDLELVRKHVVFAGRYIIEKLVGYGPHSVVFLGRDKKNGRRVAVKLVSTPELESYCICGDC